MKRFFLFLCACLTLSPCWAANQNLGQLEQLARRFVQGEVGQRTGVGYELGHLDRRLVLPLCPAPQVNWPDGMLPSGSGFVDVSCQEPYWHVRLPIRINEARMGLVLTHAVRAGDTLSSDDVRLVPIPDPRTNRDVLSDPSQVIGQSMTSGAVSGLWLRSFMVKPPIVVKMNQRVRVVAAGDGFSVESEGISTANGRAGDVVAVRMPSGQMLRGIVSQDGSVSVSN
jgi:flagella basal body P-ring formation protein FlgA